MSISQSQTRQPSTLVTVRIFNGGEKISNFLHAIWAKYCPTNEATIMDNEPTYAIQEICAIWAKRARIATPKATTA